MTCPFRVSCPSGEAKASVLTQPTTKVEPIHIIMKLYYAEICDHKGTPVITTKYYPSNRQAGAVGKQTVEAIPPAASYNVRLAIFNATYIAELANQEKEWSH